MAGFKLWAWIVARGRCTTLYSLMFRFVLLLSSLVAKVSESFAPFNGWSSGLDCGLRALPYVAFADVPLRNVVLAVGGEGVRDPCVLRWMVWGSSPPRDLRVLSAEGRSRSELTVLSRLPFWVAAAAKFSGEVFRAISAPGWGAAVPTCAVYSPITSLQSPRPLVVTMAGFKLRA
ncbi:hypothetical protein NDU88_006377 [Pleurodeles waltl]|uniref:Secreted protein n=1 Tax=Pleurodeles waltl TaxID=8319 RepID=A0AAV7VLR4_PLEWA|nr:hypothetical protein NDU88_006377 [Pleurodeles waltl]